MFNQSVAEEIPKMDNIKNKFTLLDTLTHN